MIASRKKDTNTFVAIVLVLCLAFAGCAPTKPHWRVLCVPGKVEGLCK